jgi:hypothetical protein
MSISPSCDNRMIRVKWDASPLISIYMISIKVIPVQDRVRGKYMSVSKSKNPIA